MMRLDRFLSEAAGLTRSQAGKAVREGRVTVNGLPADRPERKIAEDSDCVTLDGRELKYQAFHYYLLDKPVGLITAARDPKQPTVLDLFPPEVRRQGILPVGRLDKDTSGLLLLTDDGDFAHRVISPKSGIRKVYEATVDGVFDPADPQRFAEGLVLKDGTQCLPAELSILEPNRCLVTVCEGKYHQVRRMLASVGKPVVTLRRLSVGGLRLPEDSQPGAWRELTDEERETVFCASCSGALHRNNSQKHTPENGSF